MFGLKENYLVIDVETTTGKDGKVRAVDGRKIVLVGECRSRGMYITKQHCNIGSNIQLVVGHNLKFDLEHLRRDPYRITISSTPIYDYIKGKHATVWDTQLVTYLASGHRLMFPSLEESCKWWGVPMSKSLNLAEELPKVDWDIERVPKLQEYLLNDLEMTAKLFIAQQQSPWVKANTRWLLQMHEGLLGTFEIEYNGTHVDEKKLDELLRKTQTLSEDAEADLRKIVATLYGDDIAGAVEFTSNKDIGILLYGGKIETEDRECIGVYASGDKMGKPRYRINRKTYEVAGYPGGPLPAMVKTETGKPKVDEDVLKSLGLEMTDQLLKFRELEKLRGTYLEGMCSHLRVNPHTKQYFVHPQINMCATLTGRTSSTKPNMQNNPTHDAIGVGSIFTSRYGKDGTLVEVDFKQIEVLALAILSKDPQLIADIRSGVDIHEATGRPVFGPKMTKEQRRVIKTINFGLIYGGGTHTLSKQAGVSVATTSKAISSFYGRYPKVDVYFKDFRNYIQERCNISLSFTGNYLPGMIPQKFVTWESMTGRRYTFQDYMPKISLTGKIPTPEVSYTETRNYPIQGLATADLVLCALGDVYRKVLTQYPIDVKLIGLVHDSLRLDVRTCVLDEFVQKLVYTLENSGNALNRVCGKELWTLPVKVSVSTGPDFANMTEYNLEER